MHELQFERFCLEDLPEALLDQWLQITQSRSEFANPFFSPCFARAIALAAPEDCFVTVISNHGEVAGFFPFQFINRRSGRAGRIGLHLCDYNGVIGGASLSRSQLAKLLAVSGIHQYSFDRLHPFQQSMGLPAAFIKLGSCIDLTTGFDRYWRELENTNPEVIHETARNRRELSLAYGEPVFEFHTSTQDTLTKFIEMQREQYLRAGKPDCLGEAWTRRALSNLHAMASPHFKTALSTLTLNGALVGFHLGLLANGIFHSWLPVHLPAFSAYSPDQLILHRFIENADTLGIRSIDRGLGIAPPKENFSNHTYRAGVGALRRSTARCLFLRGQDFIQARKQSRTSSKASAAETTEQVR